MNKVTLYFPDVDEDVGIDLAEEVEQMLSLLPDYTAVSCTFANCALTLVGDTENDIDGEVLKVEFSQAMSDLLPHSKRSVEFGSSVHTNPGAE